MINKHIKKYPVLQSERLTLKAISTDKIPDIVHLMDDKRITDNLLTVPYPYREKDAIFWLNEMHQGLVNQSKFIFGIHLNQDDFVGGIGLHIEKGFKAEIGYWLGYPYWGQGIMTEALGLVLKFGFERLKLERIFAMHITGNPASGKVMVNNGMQYEGTIRSHLKKGKKYLDVRQYSILREEFEV